MEKQLHPWFLVAVVFVIKCIYLASSEVKIIEMDVPQYLKNDDGKTVILDCDYEFSKEEDLEVKWYYNDDSNLIYQWIPAFGKPQAVGAFKGVIDTTYKISNDANKEYRAIHFKQVSPALSGNYTCKISGSYGEDIVTKKMIIYEPAESFSILYVDQSKRIVCEATGISHKPEMNLVAYYLAGSNETLPPVEQDQYIVESSEDFEYNITAIYKLSDESLSQSVKFECVLSLPDTDYVVRKSFVLYSGASSYQFISGIWIILCLAIHFLNLN